MMAMGTEKSTPKALDPSMEVQILFGKHRATALLNKGCTRSDMDRPTAALVESDAAMRCHVAKSSNADESIGMATHCANATFTLLHLFQTWSCSHEF
ncbi:hypothetical protein PI126_g19724 [Phytophthora idaei]|nr:hypothetical protein PI126_g19724 [Phytophthora idaei]